MTLVTPVFSQKNCQAGGIPFACPEYFNEVKTTDPTIRLFEYKEKDSGLFFFVRVSSDPFSPNAVTNALLANGSIAKGQKFDWKSITNPLVMQMKTNHKYDLTASFGLSSSLLVEVKGFGFAVSGNKFVLGYLSDWTQDPAANRLAFDTGRGKGDHAAGCNAVVSVLNSVTKEFPDARQYCYFSALSASSN